MGASQNEINVELPEKLREQFQRLERRLFKVETVVTVAVVATGVSFSYVTLFVSDRVWNTTVPVRIFLAASALAVFLIGMNRWLMRWVLRRRGLKEMAVIVQKRFRRLGDRLLGIVELADETKRPANFSPELYRAAIEQVAEEAGVCNFEEAVSDKPARKRLALLAVALALAAVPFAVVPKAGANALSRWILPLAAIPRYTLVALEDFPKSKIVPHGEAFTVEGSVNYRSFWKPKWLSGRFEGQFPISKKLASAKATLEVPPQTRDGALEVSVGDGAAEIRIAPTHRPSLREMTASVTLPDYLKYPTQKEESLGGTLNVLEGSKIAFSGTASRPLRAASLQLDATNRVDLPPTAAQFATASLNLDTVSELAFLWEDTLGLTNSAPWRLNVQVVKDAAPAPELPDLFRDTAILETEVLQIKLRARDDYGVKTMGLIWETSLGAGGTNQIPIPEFKTQAMNTQTKAMEESFSFTPALLRVPSDSTIEVRGFATDFLPGREASETPVYRIQVMGNEKHAEMVRQKLESLLVALEEITRQEDKLVNDTKNLQENTKLSPEESEKKLGEMKDQQNQNASNLKELAEEGTKTLREAVRNPTFKEDLLTDWAKNLQEMQKVANKEMKEASKSLQKAESSPKQRSENVAEAKEKEEDSLQSLEQMQKKVNKGLDDLQALTLAQRLRKVGSQELDISGQLQKIVTDTVGLTPEQLSPRFQKANAFLSEQQTDTTKETEVLQAEISRFFERTKKENYGKVNKELLQAKAVEKMDSVKGLIHQNIALEAMQQLATWSEQFAAWADILEPKSESKPGGGGAAGGGGSGDPDATMKQLMALLRTREGEVNLRERTRLLDSQKAAPEVYAPAVKDLANAQEKLTRDVSRVELENTVHEMEKPLQEAHDSMDKVEAVLRKQNTGEPAKVAQNKSVEVLSDVINILNEKAKNDSKGGKSSSPEDGQSAEQMAFLMQMMQPGSKPGQGMKMGSTPGGNMSGGSTSQTPGAMGGDATGKGTDTRKVNKSSGVIQSVPVEFRDALESYYRALEQEPK